jgi:hypothetical protein
MSRVYYWAYRLMLTVFKFFNSVNIYQQTSTFINIHHEKSQQFTTNHNNYMDAMLIHVDTVNTRINKQQKVPLLPSRRGGQYATGVPAQQITTRYNSPFEGGVGGCPLAKYRKPQQITTKKPPQSGGYKKALLHIS